MTAIECRGAMMRASPRKPPRESGPPSEAVLVFAEGRQTVREVSQMAERNAKNEREPMPVDPQTLEFASRRATTPREREMVERALANASLMEQAYESLAAHKRGEKGTPGREVQAEAKRRRGEL